MRSNAYQYPQKPQPFEKFTPEAIPVLGVVADVNDVRFKDDTTQQPRLPYMVDVISTVASEDYARQLRMNNEDVLGGLNRLFSKREIPVGLMGKLLKLCGFNLHFKIDDSGSMCNHSDFPCQQASEYLLPVIRRNQKCLTRWEEAEDRIHCLLELLVFVSTGTITFSFLNNQDCLVLDRNVINLAADGHSLIRKFFRTHTPDGGTPILANIAAMFQESKRKGIKTAHYLLTDGEPNAGFIEINQIKAFLVDEHSSDFPFTFLSCTDNDDTKWMHQLKELIPYVSALADYECQKKEVVEHQGAGIPYTRGFWLLCSLVSAFAVEDLHAMDKPIPMVRCAINSLMGYPLRDDEYQLYFNQHPNADIFRAEYERFLTLESSTHIRSVREFNAVFHHELDARIGKNTKDPEAEANDIARQAFIDEWKRYYRSRAGFFNASKKVFRGELEDVVDNLKRRQRNKGASADTIREFKLG